MTKDVRTKEGFNKFLRRSPLSGVNHTVIGHLEDISLFFLFCNYRTMSPVPCNPRSHDYYISLLIFDI